MKKWPGYLHGDLLAWAIRTAVGFVLMFGGTILAAMVLR